MFMKFFQTLTTHIILSTLIKVNLSGGWTPVYTGAGGAEVIFSARELETWKV